MQRTSLAGLGLVLGVALFGCAPLPAPQAAVAPASVAIPATAPATSAPIVLVPAASPQLATVPPVPASIAAPSYRLMYAVHPVIHHHRVRRYASLYGPQCGSVVHPCNVFHTV